MMETIIVEALGELVHERCWAHRDIRECAFTALGHLRRCVEPSDAEQAIDLVLGLIARDLLHEAYRNQLTRHRRANRAL